MRRTITELELRDLAREAIASERTIMRRILRLPVRGLAGERADRVLHERGFLEPEPSTSPVDR